MLSKDLHTKIIITTSGCFCPVTILRGCREICRKVSKSPLIPLFLRGKQLCSHFHERGIQGDIPRFAGCLIMLFFLIITVFFTGCAGSNVKAPSRQVTLTVSAASDLSFAFQEIGAAFEQGTGANVVFNFGSSGQLAQQIREGAPVDVFASASLSFVQELEKKGLIIPGTNGIYARGRVGLWPRDNSPFYPQSIQDLARPEIKRIAIANPEHAPYGMAAMQALQSATVREVVKPKLVMGENASQTLQYAKTGNVDVAIVPLSLVIQNANPYWVLIPENLHKPIDQALGIVKTTPHEKEARQFIALVNSQQGRDIMRKYGFTLPGEDS